MKLKNEMDDEEFMKMVEQDLEFAVEERKNAGSILRNEVVIEDFGIEPGEEKAEEDGNDVEEEKVSPIREIFSWILTFAFALAAALLIRNYLIINANVPTGSMENTIMPGDRLVGNRLAYIKSEPQRGDIVIFKYPDDETQNFVKRVIGLPGETVTIEDARIYINGSTEPLLEDYLKEEWIVATGPYTFEVPEDCFFVMGDNRNDSWDARYWTNTYVTREKILGKALFTYWPFSDWGKLE